MNHRAFRGLLSKVYNLESSSRLKSFEGLRAWAVIMVFNVHFLGQYYQNHYFVGVDSFAERVFKFLHSGHIGVDLFFVLSGFLIFSTLNRNKPSFKSYISHRINRIMPAHVVVLLLLMFANIWGGFFTNVWGGFFANILFLPTFVSQLPAFNSVTWTLGWEWLFYILMFFFFHFRGDGKRGMFIWMIGFSCLLFVVAFVTNQPFRWGELAGNFIIPEPGRFAGFFVGVTVAYFTVNGENKVRANRSYVLLVPLAVVGVLISQVAWSVYVEQISDSFALRNLYYLAVSSCFGLIVSYLASNNSTGLLNLVLQSTFLRIIGQISFSFYLIHVVIALPLSFQIVGDVNSFSGMCLHYVVAFLMTVFLASFLYYYFERPYFISKKSLNKSIRD